MIFKFRPLAIVNQVYIRVYAGKSLTSTFAELGQLVMTRYEWAKWQRLLSTRNFDESKDVISVIDDDPLGPHTDTDEQTAPKVQRAGQITAKGETEQGHSPFDEYMPKTEK